jgi:nitrite reductase/ring-hydroxylating ferredoxin subunit
VRLSDFPPLQKDFGSVRIGTSAIDANHRPLGLFYPVIINRAPGKLFYALDSSCSHEGCTVPTFDAATRLIQCLCHGSQYAIDGALVRGPAGFGLRQFPLRFDGVDTLTIEQPDMSFFPADPVDIRPGTDRLHLQFLGFEHIAYEIRYRPNVSSEWSGPVAFALSEGGPADQTSVLGQADYIDVYIDRNSPQGFYAVSMKTGLV